MRPSGKLAICVVHPLPQSMPAGFELTVPEPLLLTVRLRAVRNSAVMILLLPMSSWQVPVPVQSPLLQAQNAAPADGCGVSVTSVPPGKIGLQLLSGHNVPDGLIATL